MKKLLSTIFILLLFSLLTDHSYLLSEEASKTQLSTQSQLQSVSQVQPQPKSSSTLTLASDSYTGNYWRIHPLFTDTEEDIVLKNLIFTPLIDISPSWSYRCRMCESFPTYTIKKESSKTKTITHWKLKDWYWADGSKVTSSDIKLSWQILKTNYSQTKIYHPLEYIESINIKDDKTFDIIFLGPHPDFYKIEGFYIVSSRIEKPIWEESLKKISTYKKNSSYYNTYNDKALYNGAFYFKDQHTLVSNIHLESLLKNEFFTQYKKISLFNIKPEELSYASLKGSFDIFYHLNPYLIYPGSLPVSGYRFIKNTTPIYENIAFNMQNSMFTSPLMREALSLAIDKTKIASKLGLAVATSFVNPRDPSFYPFNKKYNLDPKRASSLLEELGYVVDPSSSYRVKKDTQDPLEISIHYLNNEFRRTVVSSLKEDLKKVGIKLNPIPLTLKEYKKVIQKSSFQDLLLLSWELPIDFPPRGILYSKEIPTFDSGYSGQNIFGLRSREIDSLIDSYLKEEDQTKKHLIYARIVNLVSGVNCSIPLFFMDRVLYLKNGIKLDSFYPSFWN